MTWVDVVLVVMVAGAAVTGYRQGLIAVACSLVAAAGCAVGALAVAPGLVRGVDSGAARTALSLALLVAAVLVGEIAGGWVGLLLSERVAQRVQLTRMRTVDRTLGAVGQAGIVLSLAWLVASALASTPLPAVSASIRNSAILDAVDSSMPNSLGSMADPLGRVLNSTGYPDVLHALDATPVVDVPEPSSRPVDPAVTAAAGPSVWKVHASAPSCGRSSSGTAFVIGPDHLLTNAHVVGGPVTVRVENGSRLLDATVVDYDPELDLAVLLVRGLTGQPLTFDTAALPGQADAIVLGYPHGGPFAASPARVRSQNQISGPDLYREQDVLREAYLLRADIEPGDSGGPLVDDRGSVAGVIFGTSIDDPGTAFALTAAQVLPSVQAGVSDTSPADTRSCVSE